MVDRRIHMEVLWVEGSTQSLLYITNAYWQNLKTSVLLDSVLVNFNWMCWGSKERRNEKLKGQLEKGRLPLLMSRSSLCLIPNTRCHFARKKKPNYKTSIFENLEDSCEPRIWQASWMCTIQPFRKPFYVRFGARKQQADVQSIWRHWLLQRKSENFRTITFALESRDE